MKLWEVLLSSTAIAGTVLNETYSCSSWRAFYSKIVEKKEYFFFVSMQFYYSVFWYGCSGGDSRGI